jgi:hypothetical protein
LKTTRRPTRKKCTFSKKSPRLIIERIACSVQGVSRVDDGFVAGFARVTVRVPDPRGPGLWKWSYVDRHVREVFDPP